VRGHSTPAPIPSRRREAQLEEVRRQTQEGPVRLQRAGKQLLAHRPFGRLDVHASWITGVIRRHARAARRNGPWPEDPRAALHLTPSAPAFGPQGAFIFGHGPADLPQEMGLRVLSQRLIEERDPTASRLECFQQHHLLDIMAGGSIRAREDDTVDGGLFAAVPEPIHAWPVEHGATVPVVAEQILWPEGFPLRRYMRGEALDLLFNRLGQGLPRGRHPGRDRGAQASPPSVV
jgi:hypothetical protein